jgi:CRP-like cAMP-binding protein
MAFTFSDEMKKMCEEMGTARSERAKEMEELHSEFSHDRTERKQGVNRLFKDVHVLIQHFHSDRGKMAEEMREILEKFVADNQKGVRGLIKQYHTDRGKMAEQMRKMLREFRASHKAMSGKQREELAKSYKGTQHDVAQMRKGFQQAQKALQQEFKKAHQIYHEFAQKSQKSRQPSSFSKPASSGASSQQGKIMAALKESPSGMTRKELSYAMGMQEEAIGRSLTRMQKGGMIHKKKNLYIAA